ncbi:MAG: Cof-type HAD-IIB family hydrolase [Candidatus Aquicultorales bacterium]
MFHTPYKLVALDLDGTLLDEDHSIDPAVKSAIHEAAAGGVAFTIATGRMFASAVRFAEILELEVPLITYNGSVVRSAVSGLEHRHLRIPRDAASAAFRLLDGRALRYAFFDDHVATDTPHEWTDRYARILGVDMQATESLIDYSNGDPTMVVFMCEEHETRPFTDMLADKLDSAVRLTNSNPWFVDLLHPQASKATALEFLAASLGITLEETLAVGDSWNDIEILEAAGLGVAVANATDTLKATADYITTSERGLGVLEALRKFVL